MIINERQNQILSYLKNNKSVSVCALARSLYVSEATVRRDLRLLGDMGLVERYHGGALFPENTDEQSMLFRQRKSSQEKKQVAQRAIGSLPSFRSVFVDGSSTVLSLVEHLNLASKTVITNSLQAALLLSRRPDVNLLMLGGNVRCNTNTTMGSFTLRQIERINLDLMLCSCASVRGDECAERSLEQVELKKAVFERSEKRVLLVDNTKFGAFGTYVLSKLNDFDCVITNKKPSDSVLSCGANIIY
jgi:DeoR family glycerol-3-phosphate regulon repressor